MGFSVSPQVVNRRVAIRCEVASAVSSAWRVAGDLLQSAHGARASGFRELLVGSVPWPPPAETAPAAWRSAARCPTRFLGSPVRVWSPTCTGSLRRPAWRARCPQALRSQGVRSQGCGMRSGDLTSQKHTFCSDAVGYKAVHELPAHRERRALRHNGKEANVPPNVFWSFRARMRGVGRGRQHSASHGDVAPQRVCGLAPNGGCGRTDHPPKLRVRLFDGRARQEERHGAQRRLRGVERDDRIKVHAL